MAAFPGLLICAFLLGGIPFAYLIVRLTLGTDVRIHGSGNVGATNASRLFPPGWRIPGFLGIFLLDAGKGYVAAGLLPQLFTVPDHAPALAGLAAVVGHSFSPFLGFRGGKGVATTVGVLLALEPLATGIALAIFFVVLRLTRIVAAGSLAFAVALPAAVLLHGTAPRAVGLLAMALALLIIVRHQSNIRRMLRGEET